MALERKSLFSLLEEEEKGRETPTTDVVPFASKEEPPAKRKSLFSLLEEEVEPVKKKEEHPLLRPLKSIYEAVITAAPTSWEDVEKIKEGLKIGAKQTWFYTWPKQLKDIREFTAKLLPVEKKTLETVWSILYPEQAAYEAKAPELAPTKEEIEKIEKDEKVRAWAKIGSFAADLPRIVGTSYLLSPFLGPASSGIVRITSPVLSRVATNPKAFKIASRFLVDLPTRMLSDTAVFAALSALIPKK